MLMKLLDINPLVSGSASMEAVPICYILINPLWTLSFTARNLMSICLNYEFLLLLEYNTAELLSQYNLSDNLIVSTIRNPVTKFLSHISWFDALKHAMNIMDCIALLQKIAPPANIKYNRMLTLSYPHNSQSQNQYTQWLQSCLIADMLTCDSSFFTSTLVPFWLFSSDSYQDYWDSDQAFLWSTQHPNVYTLESWSIKYIFWFML
jgi:hypothetical protein